MHLETEGWITFKFDSGKVAPTVLMAKYELTFEEHSYGFRPEKNIHHTSPEI